MQASRAATDRATVGLGLGAAASAALGIAETPPWRIVTLGGTGTLILLVLAAAAVVAGLLAVRALIVLVGAGFLAAAALQLVQIGWTSANLLGGDGSTMALLLGFAVGLLAVGLAPRPPRGAEAPRPSPSPDQEGTEQKGTGQKGTGQKDGGDHGP